MKKQLQSLILIGAIAAAVSAQAGQLAIKGSNTFGEELGPHLIKTFTAGHPGWTIDFESKHSGYGILALLEGTCDIAASSRPLNEDEIRMARSRKISLRTHSIGYYGIAVVVHKDAQTRNLADHQARDIFTGAIRNWSAVGGPDAPIAVHVAVPTAGTYLGFQELAMERRPYREDATRHATYADIARAVGEDPHAIGYVSMSMAAHLPVRALSINGIPPTPIAVADDLYPYARLIRFFTVKSRETPAALEFIRYVRSTEGQNALEQAGFVRRFQRRLSIGMDTP